MDGLSLQLPPIPDSYYDISTYSTGYTSFQTPSSWLPRDESSRVYSQPADDYDNTTRYSNNADRREMGASEEMLTPEGQPEDTKHSDWSREEEKEETDVTDKASPRHSQVAYTLQWLSENYERAEGVCLPRCVLYQHYLDLCKKMKFTPAGAATFGKIIRQRFPKLTTRRLGTRGQSKYHYYGIGIKETSIYYHSVYTGKGLTRFSGIKLKTEGTSRKYSLSSKTGTLLPEFPNAENLILPVNTDPEKMRTFIMMYRTHCQRILDTIISANFEEVQNFLVHFWQGMPEHLLPLLTCELLPDVIALCDSILYKVVLDVLIPSSIQEMPSSLHSEMKMLAKRLPYWIETSMETVPEIIQERKLEVARTFIQNLRRQASFVHLAQTTRAVTSNNELLAQMVKDISAANFDDLYSQAGFMDPSADPKFATKMQELYSEFKRLLSKQSPIEGYTEWLDDIVEKYVLKPSGENAEVLKTKAAEFLLHWGAFSGLLMRELTLQNARSFASIHLVHLMLDEYAFLVIETQQDMETEKKLQRALQTHMKNAEEIQTKAVVRNSAAKAINSPKSKKRKHVDEYEDIPLDDSVRTNSARDLHQHVNDNTTTAFSRPFSTNKDPNIPNSSMNTDNQQPITNRSQTGAISVPPVKPYPPYNNSFDRPTYLPQFGISSYPEYVSHNSFGNSRLGNYSSEAYSQTFPSNPFPTNLSSMGSSYWPDGRTSHSFTDPYQHYNYNYNKLNATYDSLNKSTLLRNNVYQDSINRQALEPSRPYYRASHDNLQVASTLQVGPYGANFMDIAPSAGQYCYQDDLFPGSMTASFAKPFLSGPFR